MRGTWALLLLAGCSNSNDYPPLGGNSDARPPDMPSPDMPPDEPGPTSITGTVCVLSDLRQLTSCTAGEGAGLTVAIGGATTTTSIGGAFAIDMPAGATEWTISGTGFITSLAPFDPADTLRQLPVIHDTDYTALLAANKVTPAAGDGTVVVHLVDQAGDPVPDATVVLSGNSTIPSFYDSDSATLWDTDATGPLGMAWLPASAAGAQKDLLVTISGNAPTLSKVHIAADSIIFVKR